MKQVLLGATAAFALVAMGCAMSHAPGQLALDARTRLPLSGRHPAVRPAVGLPAGPSSSVLGSAGQGTMTITVEWPHRSPWMAQAIPLSTQLLRFKMSDSGGNLVVQRDLTPTGGSGSSVSSLNLQVPAGAGYALAVAAFDTASPSATTAPIAIGNASGIQITQAKGTPVTVDLAPADVPAITSLSPGSGGVGATVSIAGSGFGWSQDVAYGVLFDGTPAAQVVRTSDDAIMAVVPTGSQTGEVEVVADGVPSVSNAPFSVIASLGLSLPAPLLAQSTASPIVTALDPAGNPISDPAVTWTTQTPGLISIGPATGLLTSLLGTPGTASIAAASGQASASLLVPIQVRPLSAALSTPATSTLNAPPAVGPADPGFVTCASLSAIVTYSDGSTDSDVVWTSSNPLMATWSSGQVCSQPGAPAGPVMLTATAASEPSVAASYSFEITGYGSAEVIIQ